MMRRVAVAVLAAVTMFSSAGAAQADVAEPSGVLAGSTTTVDVDGDGAAEVVTVHAVEEQDITTGEYVFDLVVRRGVDGVPLWQLRVPMGAIRLVPAAVGPAGERGVYVIVGQSNYYVSVGSTDGVAVHWAVPFLYGGRDTGVDVYAVTAAGQTLWEREFKGVPSSSDPSRTVGMPLAVGTLRATPSAAMDLVVITGDAPLVTTEQNAASMSLHATVLDGVDGAAASSATLAQNTAYASTPVVIADIDGDGLDDYVAQAGTSSPPGAPPTVGRIVAHRGSDGTRLWETPGDFYNLETLADVTGDGVRDVLATSSWYSLDADGMARLVDGRTGATRAEVSAGAAWPTPTGFATATRYASPTSGETALELVHYDADGVELGYREVVVRGDASASIRHLGDVNGNGTPDWSYTLTRSSGDAPVEDTGVIDGGSFATLWSAIGVGQALGASVSGEGDDLVGWEPWGTYAVEVTAQRGATGQPLWTSTLVPDATETEWLDVAASDVDGDRRAEVLVTINAAKPTPVGDVPDDVQNRTTSVRELHVLDGRTGKVLWKR